jgi:hypothetical protein
MIRLTEYFSFYVLLWYFLFIFKIIPFNPVITFYLILSFVIWMTLYMMYIRVSTKKIVIFVLFGVILIKVLPILTLKYEFKYEDLSFGLSMFIVYHIILYYTKGIEPIQHYINFMNYYNTLPNNIIKYITLI